MGYSFFSKSPESLRLEGQRRARLAAIAARLGERRKPPEAAAPFDRWASLRRLRVRRPAPEPRGLPAPPSAAVVALTRLGFGPRPGDVEAFDALGATDTERLAVWLDQQLDPASIDDSAAEARIAQAGFTTLGKPLPQLWLDHMVNYGTWENHVRPFDETERATFLRAIHSRRQLFEVMVDFWHNHFNVYGYEFAIAAVWVHTDRDAIRAHALGNFRQMLEAVARTPAMLYYLDNYVNSAEDPNENYAREMLELHTLGAMNYLGNLPASQVPVDGQGRAVGYVEDDVVQAARCLTGWTVSDRDWDPDFGNEGTFLFHPPWHDEDPKTVLARPFAANQGIADGQQLFDLLAQHPGTGRHIATKLCRRLLGDTPRPAVIDAAAATFTAHHASPDQIARTIRTVVTAPEFLATWGDKVKRPFEIAVSALRAGGGDLAFALGDDDTDWFFWEYGQTGQPLFSWSPPNGYPDVKPAWNSSAPRVRSWRLANFFVTLERTPGVHYLDLLGQTPAGVRSAQEIVEFWAQRVLGRLPPAEELDELIEFMAQGHNPTFDLPLATDEDTQERLRALVALLFMSPSFLFR